MVGAQLKEVVVYNSHGPFKQTLKRLVIWPHIRHDSHMCQVLTPNLPGVNLCNLSYWKHGSRDLPLHMGSQLSVTWMYTWQHYSKVRLRTCVESWVKQKARTTLQWAIEAQIRDFACMLQLVEMNWNWFSSPKRLMGVKVHHDGFKPISYIEWRSVVASMT